VSSRKPRVVYCYRDEDAQENRVVYTKDRGFRTKDAMGKDKWQVYECIWDTIDDYNCTPEALRHATLEMYGLEPTDLAVLDEEEEEA